jgi:hypothetical protein
LPGPGHINPPTAILTRGSAFTGTVLLILTIVALHDRRL